MLTPVKRPWAKLTAAIVALTALLVACSSVPKRAGALATDEEREAVQTLLRDQLGLEVEMDDPMPRAAIASISNALFVAKKHRFRNVTGTHPFLRFFGSDSIQAVFGFMKDRIHHFGVMNADFEVSGNGLRTYAMNTGSLLWQLKNSNYISAIRVGGNRVDSIDSPRYGLIELSPSTLISANETKEIDAERFWHLSAFVHEARHSDCSGGVNSDQLSDMKTLPASCTYTHVACKMGTPIQGKLACDGNFWGAYSAEYIVLDAIATTCADCNRATLWLLKAYALESATHLNFLPDELTSQIVSLKPMKAPANEIKKVEPVMDSLLAKINAFMMAEGSPRPDLTSGNVLSTR